MCVIRLLLVMLFCCCIGLGALFVAVVVDESTNMI